MINLRSKLFLSEISVKHSEGRAPARTWLRTHTCEGVDVQAGTVQGFETLPRAAQGVEKLFLRARKVSVSPSGLS